MRKFFLYILLCLSFSGCAQKDTKKEEKKTDPAGITIPAKPVGWVSDLENIFSREQIQVLDSIIGIHNKETTNEIAIVTYDLDSAQVKTTADFEAFTLTLFNEWGIGTKEKKNGIAMIIVPNLKRIRIEVGYNLESKITNEEAKTIIDSIIVPEFKNARYYIGVSKGLQAIINEIK